MLLEVTVCMLDVDGEKEIGCLLFSFLGLKILTAYWMV